MHIVSCAQSRPDLASFGPYPRPWIKPGEPICFSYDIVAEPGPGQSKRGVILSPRPDYSSWEVICDKGTAMGGADEAPSPLGYLIMGVALCLLTHIQSYLHKAPMNIDRIRVEVRAEYATLAPDPDHRASGTGGQGIGRCDGYSCHVLIDSPEPAEKLQDLIAVCRDACMAIATLAREVPTTTRLFINDQQDGVPV